MSLLDKIAVVLLVALAIVGIVVHVRREQKAAACDGACAGCALAQKCKKSNKNLDNSK